LKAISADIAIGNTQSVKSYFSKGKLQLFWRYQNMAQQS